MSTFRELVEGKTFSATFKDPMGNKKTLYTNGRIINSNGVRKGITDLEYILNKADVTKETGNSGYKHVSQYLMKRINQAADKAKNNEGFAKELNKILKTNIFN